MPILVCVSAIGCDTQQVSREVGSPPTNLSDGVTKVSLLGTWKNKEESYTFSKDGTFKMHYDKMVATGPSTKGRKVGDGAGKWSANDDKLMLDVKGSKHTLIYRLKDKGHTLSLRPTYVREALATVYKRQK